VGRDKKIKLFTALLSLTVYMVFILFIDFYSLEEGYKVTIFLPIIFIFCFYGFLWEPLTQKKTPFLVLFSLVAFVRYVVLSIAIIKNGTYLGLSGIPPSTESLTLAGILMCWEILVTSALIRYWSMRKVKSASNEVKKFTSHANLWVYILFILVTAMLMLIVPQAREGLSFFGNINRSLNDEIGSLIILGIRECVINAKYFMLFVVIIILLQLKNNIDLSKNRLLRYIGVLVACVIVMGLRIGTNRKKMLADALGAILMLWNLFPKYKKTTAISLISVGIVLVASTTVFRGMTDSIGGFFSEYFDLNFLQPYFLGQYNIAIAIEAVNFYPGMIDYKTYLFSFLRPLIGIGAIVKNIDFTMAANLFDARMSAGLSGWRGDHILPMIGEGYMLFGIFFSPIISIITARIGVFFDSLYSRSERLETVFIASIVAFYLAQGMILNSTIILNMLSYRLVIYVMVVYLAYACSNKKT
jgi:hypothetical protein